MAVPRSEAQLESKGVPDPTDGLLNLKNFLNLLLTWVYLPVETNCSSKTDETQFSMAL